MHYSACTLRIQLCTLSKVWPNNKNMEVLKKYIQKYLNARLRKKPVRLIFCEILYFEFRQ
jgi:hypothetical protein